MAAEFTYSEDAVVKAIAEALETFYASLIQKIDGLNIQKVMKRKNPYLYRAKAMQNAAEIVESVLTAFVSSSEETIFGNCFFEPIAIAASGGRKALAEGIDIMLQDVDVDCAVFNGHGGQVLLAAGFDGIGNQLFHFLSAAYNGYAGIIDLFDDISAGAADIKLRIHKETSCCIALYVYNIHQMCGGETPNLHFRASREWRSWALRPWTD